MVKWPWGGWPCVTQGLACVTETAETAETADRYVRFWAPTKETQPRSTKRNPNFGRTLAVPWVVKLPPRWSSPCPARVEPFVPRVFKTLPTTSCSTITTPQCAPLLSTLTLSGALSAPILQIHISLSSAVNHILRAITWCYNSVVRGWRPLSRRRTPNRRLDSVCRSQRPSHYRGAFPRVLPLLLDSPRP